MKKVLSVIIPVYNMEKYIRQCLESLMIKEVLDKIEILVVLDGSTDRSEEIAMEYAKAHPYSVRVISKPNGGHGSAIKTTGMDNAVGEYVKVLDSDDWVNEKGFVTLVENLEGRSRYCVLNFFWVYEQTGKRSVQNRHPFQGWNMAENTIFMMLRKKRLLKCIP